jgi:hypothetical protein
MLLSASTAAWCSLLWALAALQILRWSLAQQRSTMTRHAAGMCSKDAADSLAINSLIIDNDQAWAGEIGSLCQSKERTDLVLVDPEG